MLKKICCLAVMAASIAVTAGAQTANGAERRKQALQGTYLVAPGGFVISPDDVYHTWELKSMARNTLRSFPLLCSSI